MQWNAVIFGPAETPFEDGTFKLTISKNAENISSACALSHYLNYKQKL
jgi:hypothetical protein